MPSRRWLPVAIAVTGALASLAIASAKPRPLPARVREDRPLVAVTTTAVRNVQVAVRSQGSVEPRSEIDLSSEVAGRVVFVSASLAAGGVFREGDVLVELDDEDTRDALEGAEASAERVGIEVRQAASVLERLRALVGGSVASAAQLEDAEYGLDLARARRREADASRQRARRAVDHTRIVAPFTGRVRSAHTHVGQFVSRGEPLARVYSTLPAEIRLPLPDSQLALLDLPQPASTLADFETPGPLVNLTASFAGHIQRWTARIVRVEGEVDPLSRMLHVVARLDEPPPLPGWQGGPASGPPAVGLFVEAEILGQRFENVMALPRVAFRDDQAVLIVGEEGRVEKRRVTVARFLGDDVLISSGLAPGERVCVSPTPPLAGATVRPVEVALPRGEGVGDRQGAFIADARHEP